MQSSACNCGTTRATSLRHKPKKATAANQKQDAEDSDGSDLEIEVSPCSARTIGLIDKDLGSLVEVFTDTAHAVGEVPEWRNWI